MRAQNARNQRCRRRFHAPNKYEPNVYDKGSATYTFGMLNRYNGFLLVCFLAASAAGQALEPRLYSNAPKGINFFLSGYTYSRGGLSTDPALQLTDANLDLHMPFAAYARSGAVFGKSAKFDVVVPYGFLSGSAVQGGTPLEREVDGFADPQFRGSINLIGAPALTLKEFGDYRQNFILGTSLQVSAPMGQYDSGKVVNIGQNRWSFKPELGA